MTDGTEVYAELAVAAEIIQAIPDNTPMASVSQVIREEAERRRLRPEVTALVVAFVRIANRGRST